MRDCPKLAALFSLPLLFAASTALAQALSPDPVLKPDAPVDPHRPLAQELRSSASPALSITAVGSLLLDSPDKAPPAFDAGVQAILAGRDRGANAVNVTVGVLEAPILDLAATPAYPLPWNTAPVLRVVPATAAMLKGQGFSALMLATDHALDWGAAGMRATAAALDQAGLARAGTGETASKAAHAAYYDQPQGGGRIGFVSTTTSFRPTSEALDQQGAAPGRPGVHGIETAAVRLVTPNQLSALQTAACRFEHLNDAAPCAHLTPEVEVTAFNARFRAGAGAAAYGTSVYELNVPEAATFLSGIREGKQNADLLVAAIHAGQIGDGRTGNPPPPEFLRTLARAAITSGADMVIATGQPVLGPVEIYPGANGLPKPIFYGLGNFAWSPSAKPADNGAGRQGIMVRSIAGPSALRIELYPLDLSAAGDSADGWPRRATLTVANVILTRLQAISQPFGTNILIESQGDTAIGVITVPNPVSGRDRK